MEGGDHDRRDVRPDPDPTRLSAALIHREVEQLRREMAYQREVLDEHHRTLCTRIEAIERRIDQSDEMRKELKADHQRSLDQALDTQREATERQEAATARSFAEQARTMAADTRRLEERQESNAGRLSDLTQRVVGLEERSVGARTDRSSIYATVGAIVAVALVVLSIVEILG